MDPVAALGEALNAPVRHVQLEPRHLCLAGDRIVLTLHQQHRHGQTAQQGDNRLVDGALCQNQRPGAGGVRPYIIGQRRPPGHAVEEIPVRPGMHDTVDLIAQQRTKLPQGGVVRLVPLGEGKAACSGSVIPQFGKQCRVLAQQRLL